MSCAALTSTGVLLLLAASGWLISGARSRADHAGDVLAHLNRVRSFRCEEPQLRVVPLSELLVHGPETDETFLPDATVLLRCDAGCGYCGSPGEECGPAEFEHVKLAFFVKHHVDTARRQHREVVVAKNHTRCECMSHANSIR